MMKSLIVFLVIVSILCVLLVDAKKSGKGKSKSGKGKSNSGKGKSKGGNPFAELEQMIADLEAGLRADFDGQITALQAQLNSTGNCCSNLTDLEERIGQLGSKEVVAFHAYRSINDSLEFAMLNADEAITFPAVYLNEGLGYDGNSTFTAPGVGVYLFSVLMCAMYTPSTFFIRKTDNPDPIAITKINPNSCTSFDLIIKLNATESVVVETGSPGVVLTTAEHRPSFSGVKIA